MSKIWDMLKKEKVEWKRLGEVIQKHSEKAKKVKDISLVYTVSKEDGIIPSIEYWTKTASKQRVSYEMYSADTSNYYVIRKNMFAYNPARLNIGSIGCLFEKEEGLLSPMYVVFKIDENILNPKYLLYFLKQPRVIKQIDDMKEVGARFRFDFNNWNKIKIPIPSLEAQEKIVDILDRFTECTTNLCRELNKELELRIKQYEYYLNLLFSEDFLKSKYKLSELRHTTLGEVGIFTRGNGLQKKDFCENGFPVIHYGQIYTHYNFATSETVSHTNELVFNKLRKAKQHDILIATTSENFNDVGKCIVWLGDEKIGFSGDMYSYRTTENSKYIAYYFQTTYFQKQKEKKVTGTKLIRIHGDELAKFSIVLPPIKIQEEIVNILDKFHAIVHDLKIGLPREIELRQQQYEYYRGKLLDFKRID